MFVGSDDTSQGSLFTDTVRLSESFFEQLQKHPVPIEEAEWVGVPYGSRARLILLFLQSEALRTGGREIELGRSLRAW